MKNILKWNPEFVKNIWMEFSPQRLIAMPAIILIIVVLIFSNSANSEKAWSIVHYMSLTGFAIVGLLWGIKTSSDAILDEYNEKTWDWQKMSIIGPWKLAFGKLFGSTIYNWYGALICWALYMFSARYTNNPINEYKTGLLLIISMISLHGLMILFALQMIRKSDGRKKIRSNRIFISGILFLGVFSNILKSSIWLNESFVKLSWYSLTTNTTNMAILSAAFYCAWIIAALYRSMRAELQFSDTPVWWLLFWVSNFFFQYGYFAGSDAFSATMGFATCLTLVFLETLFMVYFLSLSEAKDIVNFRLLKNSLQNKAYRLFFQNIPLWLTTLPIAIAFGLLAAILLSLTPFSTHPSDIFYSVMIKDSSDAFLVLLAVLAFVIRDLGILLLLNFASRSKRADGAMIIYLFLLYALIPMLTKDLGIAAFFYPNANAGLITMVIFPMIEASIVLFFLVKQWKSMNRIPTVK